ncbi:putative GTP diphosphokinase CRSH, chloroplastic [Drosera capensis]
MDLHTRDIPAAVHRPLHLRHRHRLSSPLTRRTSLLRLKFSPPPASMTITAESTPIPTPRTAAEREKKVMEQPGGRMVAEVVGLYNELTERMTSPISKRSSRILFKALKVSVPLFRQFVALREFPDGRSRFEKALDVAVVLADLQDVLVKYTLFPLNVNGGEPVRISPELLLPPEFMDAEVISAAILREVWEAGLISIDEVKDRVGAGTGHLLYESWRMKKSPFNNDVLDDKIAGAVRKFCLTYYDIRAIILDLALKLDTMRHLDYVPRYQQQIISLEVMKIHAPLAHTIGVNLLSLELEDLSFRYLFPYSYLYVDTWLRSHETGSKPLIDIYKDELLQALEADPILRTLTNNILVNGRYKSRYSTMKKLLKDGRKPEEVNDIMGLRVIMRPKPGTNSAESGERACYRAREIIRSLWKEMPHRTKDYIAKPKENGYKSLHMAVDVSENGRSRPLMEVQIRTEEMEMLAAGGTASHSLYKGGLTDPLEAKRLKAIMMAAAELAALRLKDIPSTNLNGLDIDQRGRAFQLLDKNGDGRISIEELMEVMEELGAQRDDAQEMMQLLDSNSDGSLSSEEFDNFQKQVEIIQNIEDRDEKYKAVLQEKLPMPDYGGLVQVRHEEPEKVTALI